ISMPTVLITGATRGIGRALVSELADDHHLILGGRDRADLRELAAQLPSARPFPADLTDPPAVAEQVAALDLAQGLDGLVHSAGVLVRGRIEEDRKSTRLNSSHVAISYAGFCLKKKKKRG